MDAEATEAGVRVHGRSHVLATAEEQPNSHSIDVVASQSPTTVTVVPPSIAPKSGNAVALPLPSAVTTTVRAVAEKSTPFTVTATATSLVMAGIVHASSVMEWKYAGTSATSSPFAGVKRHARLDASRKPEPDTNNSTGTPG